MEGHAETQARIARVSVGTLDLLIFGVTRPLPPIKTLQMDAMLTSFLSVGSRSSWPLPVVAASPSPTANALPSTHTGGQAVLRPIWRGKLGGSCHKEVSPSSHNVGNPKWASTAQKVFEGGFEALDRELVLVLQNANIRTPMLVGKDDQHHKLQTCCKNFLAADSSPAFTKY
jgi:hypothetical protein